ncbi:MAG: FHA domain-containing protein [Deltaproteobacteria bacterium]|nr:FHA domain-containing protein [Deltaproteobacteria bacterium]
MEDEIPTYTCVVELKHQWRKKMENQKKYVLKIYRIDSTGKPDFQKVLEFESFSTLKIGRGTATDILLEDKDVSLMHGYLTVESDGQCKFSGTGENTRINGNWIRSAYLEDGDEIQIGNTLLVFGQHSGEYKPSVESSEDILNQSVVVSSFYNEQILQKNIIVSHMKASRRSRKIMVSKVLMIAGALVLLSGVFAMYKSITHVREQQAINGVIKDIAKQRGLSDKFVPEVKGNALSEIGFISLSLLGALLFISGISIYSGSKKELVEFSIGEDPKATLNCSSKGLGNSRFPVVKLTDSAQTEVSFSQDMTGFLIDQSMEKLLLPELISRNLAVPGTASEGCYTYTIEGNQSMFLKHGPYGFRIESSPESEMKLPLNYRRGLFSTVAGVSLMIAVFMAFYASTLSDDPVFGNDVDQKEVTIRTILKTPPRTAEIRKRKLDIMKEKLQNKKEIYASTKNASTKNSSSVRDPRTRPSTGKGGSQGNSSPFASTGSNSGVANVLASQINIMTASLTASNTVFGQETENFDDILGVGDTDGEMAEDSFGSRGAGGAPGGSGNLGIGGNGVGWGGIFPGGGGLVNGQFRPGPGEIKRKIRMRDGRAEVAGKLDANEVRSIIRAHRNQVHHCYQKSLMINDNLAGTLRVVFIINSSGRVHSCSITDRVGNVGGCVCRRLTTWRFPQPQGGMARISYAWTLQPGN